VALTCLALCVGSSVRAAVCVQRKRGPRAGPRSRRRSASEMSRLATQQFSARADETDLDAVLTFLGSGDGARYLALQSEVRHIVYDALDSLVVQEPIPDETPSVATLRRRQELLSLTLDYRIVKDGGGPSPSDLYAGSAAATDYSARHDGLALDALIDEYEQYLPQFHAFTDSPTAKLTKVGPQYPCQLSRC
jgi:hypothetical protein